MEEGSSGKHWDKSSRRDNPDEMQDTLFDRLSPMLVLRILPMRIYSDLSCSFLYGCLSVATVGGMVFLLNVPMDLSKKLV